uniref:Uncharacterized protein n=1 Tax=Arundo donax TaxID=35708 RepID=A0A0A9FQG7_ARUDO
MTHSLCSCISCQSLHIVSNALNDCLLANYSREIWYFEIIFVVILYSALLCC